MDAKAGKEHPQSAGGPDRLTDMFQPKRGLFGASVSRRYYVGILSVRFTGRPEGTCVNTPGIVPGPCPGKLREPRPGRDLRDITFSHKVLDERLLALFSSQRLSFKTTRQRGVSNGNELTWHSAR